MKHRIAVRKTGYFTMTGSTQEEGKLMLNTPNTFRVVGGFLRV